MNQLHSIQTEQFEQKLRESGRTHSALTYMDGKLYLADGRFDELTRNNEMVDVAALMAAKPGEIDESDIYTNRYLVAYSDYEKIHDAIEGTSISPREAAGKVAGASGPESLTHYETIRKSTEMIGNVIGQSRILEELNAINIADKVSTSSLKGEYVRRTTSLLKVEQEIPDRQIPGSVRHAYSIGKKEIFADATSWSTELRDKDTKVDLEGEFMADLPGMFLQSKHDKVIALVNAVAGNNQGNWKAVTGNFFDVDASLDVKVAEKAIEHFAGEFVMLAHSDTITGYYKNQKAALDGNSKEGRDDTAKSGTLVNNRRVRWYETDDITSESYVLAKKGSFMKWLQGHIINTFYDDPRMSGAPKTKFFFDFNGFDISQVLAVYRALTTLS